MAGLLGLLGTVGGAVIGGPVGAAIGAGLSNFDAQNQARENADRANAQTVENYKHRHQWEVDDLKAAGLNPVLSANSAGSVGAMQAAPVQDTTNKGLVAVSTAKQLELMNQQLREATAKADLAEAETASKTTLKGSYGLNDPLDSDANAKGNYQARSYLDVKNDIQIASDIKSLKLMDSQRVQNNASTALSLIQAQNARYDSAGKRAESQFYNSTGVLSPTMQQILPILKLLMQR